MNADLLTTARWWLLNSRNLPWSRDVNDAMVSLIGEKLGFAPDDVPDAPIAPLPGEDATPHIALCLGHARSDDEGNVGAGGVSEEDYNLPVVEGIGALLRSMRIRVTIITHYPGKGYTAAMTWLAEELLRRECTAAIEFHFNASAGGKARGHEVLYWERSTNGVRLAVAINRRLNGAFAHHPWRGTKPRNHKDRGALFLSLTHCPAAIVEPFFGDNLEEWKFFSDETNRALYMEAVALGIQDFVEGGLE